MNSSSILSPSKKNNTIVIKQQFQMEIQTMNKNVFQNYHTQRCQIHCLKKQFVCLKQKCQYNRQILCKDCEHCEHQLVNLNKIVPQLNQWILRQNQQISQQNKKLIDQWKIVQLNIKYCIDIFNQLLKIIQNHLDKRIYAPKIFIQITNIVYGMFTHDPNNKSPQNFISNLTNLQKKFNLFQDNKQNRDQTHTWLNISCNKLQNQKMQRLNQAQQANKKSKKFSQKALAFTQTLAQMIESKIKEEEIKVKIKQMKIKNQLNLKDLMKQISIRNNLDDQKSNLQNQKLLSSIQKFTLQIPYKDQNGSSIGSLKDIEDTFAQIKNLKNLKQLRINNKNGKIDHKSWYHILNYVDMLKFLKQLKLTLSQSDIKLLSQLFKSKHNVIRQVQNLTLQITDQKDLNLDEVNKFLSTFELRKLTIILTRNNLNSKKITEFIKKLKIYTSLSQLPLIQLNMNFSANKIHNDQKLEIDKLFETKCKDIKIKEITF